MMDGPGENRAAAARSSLFAGFGAAAVQPYQPYSAAHFRNGAKVALSWSHA